jgi:FHS family L-fucose permease-like MFS transporter
MAYSLFFVFGSITSLNDVLMPKLRELFQLNYAEMTLVQFCFFTSYALISIPASYLIDSLGYMRSVTVGLALMAAGCLLFIPAAGLSAFPAFLGALFVIAAGVTVVQVTANPLVIDLGAPANTPRRLTLAHACNSIGTVVAPYVGATLILGTAGPRTSTATPASVISGAYAAIALLLLLVAGTVWSMRNYFTQQKVERQSALAAFELLRRPTVRRGVIAMFLYVGAEVAIGSLLVNYLILQTTLHLTAESAGKHLAFYWGGLLIGRLCGLVVLRFVSAPALVIGTGVGALLLVILSMSSTGPLAGWALLAVGLCNSVMFPLIFDLTSRGLGEKTSEGSGLICVAIAGGAFVPLLTGRLADLTSLSTALIVPALCYGGITAFGYYVYRRQSPFTPSAT